MSSTSERQPATGLPTRNLAHPEQCVTLQSNPGQISHLVQAGVYSVTLDEETDSQGIVSRTGQPWVGPNPEFNAAPFLVHIECNFLNRDSFRVRLGLEAYFPFEKPYPIDSEFPPPGLRHHLFPNATEPVSGDQRDDLVCGLELRAGDGEIWVNPRGSSWELKWEQSLFSLCASWNQHKRLFEQAPLGPFSPTLLPNGILNVDGVLVGSELLILDVGEKIQSGGPGRHKQAAGVDTDPIPDDARGEASAHFGGRFLEEKAKVAPPPFLWSDRGWGILMKKPVAVAIAGLQDGRGILSLLMGEGMLDYIVVVGDALEACKQEYPVE